MKTYNVRLLNWKYIDENVLDRYEQVTDLQTVMARNKASAIKKAMADYDVNDRPILYSVDMLE